jgi:hypothetical protein
VSNAGTALLDFGVTPTSDASLVIVGQADILTTSYVEVWVNYVATADHTADEQLVEPIRVLAGSIVNGVGFTIYGVCDAAFGTYGKFSVSWVWI